ncbi:protein dispatched homolog 1-like [Aplysia californica]|uniref:Protein dispatched homolog 1-like n=1 Tax=Aplysia californica TaxID=6500 RepID=A0ABM0JMB1_APLCA|nr:protein dispatched homolog 1-like [Aplysia californica]
MFVSSDKGYSRVVVTSSRSRSLFNYEDLRSMCSMETTYFQETESYQDICIRREADGSCCPAWSLANYVALLRGRSSCKAITARDVTVVRRLLTRCAPFFHNFSLGPNCAGDVDAWFYSPQHPPRPCPGVPQRCKKYNAVYHILHFLADSTFLFPGTPSYMPSSAHSLPLGRSESYLKFSSMFLPVVAGSASVKIFQHLESMPRDFKGLRVVGAYFGVKYTLFERYLILDSVWLGVACGVIFVAMWLYTTSIFVTFMTFLSMFWAVEVAYFLYTFVFKIKFFPYMNMVTLIVIIGVGADDLYIYCKVWHLAKAEKNNGVLEKIVSDTLRHTALSMLVTSLTTATSFYANYISDISAIRCFSIFAGTCMLINFVLTITWLPASVMLYEKWCRCCVGLSNGDYRLCFCVCKFPYKIYYLITDWSRIFFEKLLPCLVIKFRYLWILLFGGLWLASILVIFYYPRLKLPNTHKFQVFASDHLLERYDFELSDMFDFERVKDGDDVPMFPITIVWGILASDNGDPLDPYNRGSLTFDPHFDLTTPNAQRWLLDFCAKLRRTDFYLQTPGLQLTDCFLEKFTHDYMRQPCITRDTECCNHTNYPFSESKMVSCLSNYIPLVRATPYVHYNSHSPGPRFDNGRISAFFVQFLSNHTFSHSYEAVQTFYRQVNQWVNEELLHAPMEMRRGWFISHLHFFDLQSSLAVGTPLALGVSLAVVAIVSFFTTLNVLISMYALLAVAATISVTLACLVLMEWELDVLESVVITVAVGLAIDLTLHYGVAFRLAPDVGREMRVINSIGRMGSPVSMAALTTMLAGAFMMPSTILAYRKFGVFLLLLVGLAWLYATFFFQSLLRIIGPHGGFGQFHWPASDCCAPASREHVDKTIYALSESTLSSSSTSTREHSHHGHHHGHHRHSRELEPLTDPDSKPHYHRDTDPRRHQRLHAHYHHHHHTQQSHHAHPHHQHHRARRKGEYTSVRTDIFAPEDSPSSTSRTRDSPAAIKTGGLSANSSCNDTSTLTVAADSLNSTPSPRSRELSSEFSDPGDQCTGRADHGALSDTDSVTSSVQRGTTQAQVEIFPHTLPLQVA